MKTLAVLVIALGCLLQPVALCQQPAGGTITPGVGVGAVKLGSSLADFNAVFPPHPQWDESMSDDWCHYSSYHWLDMELHANGVYAYLKNNKIEQLRVQTPRFSLANGLKVDASAEKVKRIYPGGRLYVLRFSSSKVVGGVDLQYWVDNISGIAFEFYWDSPKKRRSVGSIDIFRSGTEYRPEGCVAPPREWVRDPRPQLHFSAEDDGVDHPATIPPDVMAVLKADEMVRNALENENISAEKIPLSWFSASPIHLNSPRQRDLVVEAEGALAGGNVITFWIFRATAHGHELVLKAPAHDLIVKNTRWNGYRNVELASMSAAEISTVLCRFDGKKYARYKAWSKSIR